MRNGYDSTDIVVIFALVDSFDRRRDTGRAASVLWDFEFTDRCSQYDTRPKVLLQPQRRPTYPGALLSGFCRSVSMVAWRGRVRSGDEPAAFRIDRHGEPESYTSDWDLQFGPRSTDVPSRPSRYNSRTTNVFPEMSGVDSVNFKPHEFLQRMFEERADNPLRTVHPGPGENSFDADSALAALDSIEYALQKRRDVALKDEQSAREDLRQQLHSSLKTREELTKVADSVSAAVNVTAADGKKAAAALQKSIGPLSSLVEERKSLVEARDLVLLLTARDNGLNVVRASEILAKLREETENRQLSSFLSPDELAGAKLELDRCEAELSHRLTESLKESSVPEESALLRNCAVAAENLRCQDKFMYAYISLLPIFSRSTIVVGSLDFSQDDVLEGSQPTDALGRMHWECVTALRNFLPVAISSFPDPLAALSKLVKKMFHEKLVQSARHVLNRIQNHSSVLEARVQESRRSMDEAIATDFKRYSVEAAAELKTRLNALTDESLDSRQRLLQTTSHVFKLLTASVHEFIEVCLQFGEGQSFKSKSFHVPVAQGASDKSIAMKATVKKYFSEILNDLLSFLLKQQRNYTVLEKMWIDEKIGKAFCDISKLDAEASELAPSETSEPEDYHKYRLFYSPIAAAHGDMTRNATSCALESLHRSTSMLMTSIQVRELCGKNELDSVTDAQVVSVVPVEFFDEPSPASERRSLVSGAPHKSEEFTSSEKEQLRRMGFQSRVSDLHLTGMDLPGTDEELNNLITSISYSLVQNYLANAETLLQAGSYLLPATAECSKGEDLWVAGSSPLAAYVKAIGALTDSDKLLDDFLANIVLNDTGTDPLLLAGVIDCDIANSVQVRIRNEIRRELITGLKDLAVDAKAGVEAAVSAVGTRLLSIFSTRSAFEAYVAVNDTARLGSWRRSDRGNSSLENEPSEAFMSACTFIGQQLAACRGALSGHNLEYLTVCMAETVRDVVIQHWASCKGPFSKTGALLLMVNARAIVRVFPAGSKSCDVVSVLSVLAQLHFDSPDEIWSTLESDSLSRIKTSAILKTLEKRGDLHSLQKIRDALRYVEDFSSNSSPTAHVVEGGHGKGE